MDEQVRSGASQLADFLDLDGQYPPFVKSLDDKARWTLALRVTEKTAGRDDPMFTERMYFDPSIPTFPAVDEASPDDVLRKEAFDKAKLAYKEANLATQAKIAAQQEPE
jgi:hypothetical protein